MFVATFTIMLTLVPTLASATTPDDAWFKSAEAFDKIVAKHLDTWYQEERRYLANHVKCKASFDQPTAALPDTIEWFRAPIRERQEAGEEDGRMTYAWVDTGLEYYTLYDTPVSGVLHLSKTSRKKDVPFRVFIGARHVEESELPVREEQRDEALAELHTEAPGPFATEDEDLAIYPMGRLPGSKEGQDPDLHGWIQISRSNLPPLVNVSVWHIGTVMASGTKEAVAERALTDLRAQHDRSFVMSFDNQDEDILDGPIVFFRYTKPLKKKDVLEPITIFGEEKNYRQFTMYFSAIGFGAARRSALNGLFDTDKLCTTDRFQNWQDVFARHDFVETKFKKSNFMTMDKFSLTRAFYEEGYEDHSLTERAQKKRKR